MKYANIIMILIIMALSAVVITMHNKKQSLQNILDYQQDSIRVWKDKYNLSHAERNILEVDRDNFRNLYKEEIKKDFNINSNRVEQITKVVTATSDNIEVPVVEQKFNYNNDFIKISGTLFESKIQLEYNYIDSLSFITYYKRYFFKPNEYKVQVISKNPRTTFTSLDHVVIRERKKRFSVNAGIYYTNAGVVVGVGIGVNILSF